MRSLPSVSRAARWLPELLLVLPLIAASRLWKVFPKGSDPAAALVSGPDAGAWAMSAIAVANGDFDQVDPHRLPTFLFLTAAASTLTGDIPQAGHLVTMGAWFTMVVATTLLGRAAGGPLVGALAGLLITTPGPLLHAATRFGVDPVIAAVLPLSLAAVAPARRRWWLALPAGAIAGVTMCTHFTTLPYGLTALTFLLVRGGPKGESWRTRIARPTLFVCGAALLLGTMSQLFASVDADGFLRAISEGIFSQRAIGPGNQEVDGGSGASLSREAWNVLQTNSGTAWNRGATSALQPWYWSEVPWNGLLGALWLGVLGVRRSNPTKPRAESVGAQQTAPSRRPQLDLAGGVVLLLCLAPIPVLAAASAPERYGSNLLPFVAVLLARGCASPIALLGWMGGRPVQAAASVGLIGLLASPLQRAQDFSAQGIPPITGNATQIIELSGAIERTFPGDSAIVTPMIESAAMISRPICPRQNCWGSEVEVCLNHIRSTCPGDGPIPLVWLERGPRGMGDDLLSQAVGATVAEAYGVQETVETTSMRAVLVSIPRSPTD